MKNGSQEANFCFLTANKNFILKKHQPPLAPTANGGYFCCVSFNIVTSASIYIAAAAEH